MSRFRAKRSSRCCELCRNVGLRDIGGSRHRGLGRNAVRGVASCREMRGCAAAVLVATGLGVSTPFFYCVSRSAFGPWLLTPHGAWLSGARAAVALAMPNLAFRGAGSNFSRRIGLGFSGMRAVAIAARRSAAGGECGERVRKRCANPTIRAALAMQKWQTRADAGQTRIRPL